MGLDICRHLAKDGHRVAVLDIDGGAAERAARELVEAGAEAVAAAVDVSDRAAVDHALDEVRRRLGPVEIIVTSAAIAEFVPFTEITSEQWDRMLAIDLTGTFHSLQAAIPDMVAGRWGRIVTIASSAGQIGSVRQVHYAAAKGGVIALTKAVAREYGAHGITANTIPPFTVDTPMLRAGAGRRRQSIVRRDVGPHPRRSARHRRRHRRGVRLLVLGPGELHHRTDHRRQRGRGRMSRGVAGRRA